MRVHPVVCNAQPFLRAVQLFCDNHLPLASVQVRRRKSYKVPLMIISGIVLNTPRRYFTFSQLSFKNSIQNEMEMNLSNVLHGKSL